MPVENQITTLGVVKIVIKFSSCIILYTKEAATSSFHHDDDLTPWIWLIYELISRQFNVKLSIFLQRNNMTWPGVYIELESRRTSRPRFFKEDREADRDRDDTTRKNEK